MANPQEKWTWSDKLAIALTCIGAAMALILFVLEKTPLTIAVIIACVAALLIYPILHFVPSRKYRILFILVMIVAVCLFGWCVWPKRPQISPIVPPPARTVAIPTPSLPEKTPQHEHKIDRPHEDAGARPSTTTQAHTINVQPGAVVSFGQQGGITAGQVVIAQESTIPVELSISQEQVMPPHPNSFPYELRVTIKTSRRIEPTTLALLFDGPVEVPDLPFTCMSCGSGRLNDVNGIANPATVWVFWSSPPFTPDYPIIFTVESLHPVKLLRVSKGPKPPS